MSNTKQVQQKSEIYCWFLQVAMVLTLISLVIWLCLIPRCPIFKLNDFRILGLDVQNSTLHQNNSFSNDSIVLGIEIFNPNKGMSVYYSDIYFTMNYSKIAVSSNSMPGFYQTGKDRSQRTVLMKSDLRLLQQLGDGNATFKIGLETTVQYRIFRWKTKHHKMDYEAYVYNVTDLEQSGTLMKRIIF